MLLCGALDSVDDGRAAPCERGGAPDGKKPPTPRSTVNGAGRIQS